VENQQRAAIRGVTPIPGGSFWAGQTTHRAGLLHCAVPIEVEADEGADRGRGSAAGQSYAQTGDIYYEMGESQGSSRIFPVCQGTLSRGMRLTI
jgi:hypothetical protein